MMNIAKISEKLRSLIYFHAIADIFPLNFEEPVLRAQLEFEFNSFSPDMFYFQSFLNYFGNESASIRNGLFSKNHINSKKNRRKKLNSSIDRKLNVDFRKNNEKFWKKSLKLQKSIFKLFQNILNLSELFNKEFK